MMNDTLFWIVAAACLIVAAILIWGVGTFGSGRDPKKANKIMRYRIAAQFVAVILIVGFVWLRQRAGN